MDTKVLRRKLRHVKEDRQLILMTLPAVIKIFIFSYLPMFGIVMAFKDYVPVKGILGSSWNGFANFEFFFKSVDAWKILRNTIGLNAMLIVVELLASVCFALLLYEVTSKRMLKVYQSVMFFPYFFSWVLVGLMLTTLLNPSTGMLTTLIRQLTGNEVSFYSEPWYWLIILPLVGVWKGTGFGSLIYYSALMSIDRELFEAAEIDGATKVQSIRHISIPFLAPMMVMLTILSIGHILRADFGLFYFVPRNVSVLYPVTDVLDTYVFRALTVNGDFGMSAAVGVFQSVVGFVLILGTNKLAKLFNKEYGLF
ncbi:putative aldouronate transport system permease protein [Paenibacillus sp. UNCCL117]|uniref:ABC transporter permease n=1 Tax=unclassified Paenibacillus TaxID=185978 RepID=UPI0008902FC4|nr:MULTISPECIES: ABC transporter permease subunit [unclassified Paenibacillus]SDD48026.1 putative aldouronate transport system permease protein [Paenibacillus sp. cl123]SFW50328.1 putative aldouronate transport system permease protein [Paenibacillus sp. UNCCL117]